MRRLVGGRARRRMVVWRRWGGMGWSGLVRKGRGEPAKVEEVAGCDSQGSGGGEDEVGEEEGGRV